MQWFFIVGGYSGVKLISKTRPVSSSCWFSTWSYPSVVHKTHTEPHVHFSSPGHRAKWVSVWFSRGQVTLDLYFSVLITSFKHRSRSRRFDLAITGTAPEASSSYWVSITCHNTVFTGSEVTSVYKWTAGGQRPRQHKISIFKCERNNL